MTTTATAPPERGAEDPVARMFASRSMTEHVARGILGAVLMFAAFALVGTTPWSLLLAVPAVVAWRGCPTCWALGLAATISRGRVGCTADRCDPAL